MGVKHKFQGRVVQTTRGRYGRKIVHREVIAPCARCNTPFTFTMTTKPARHCDGCRAIVKAEKRKRDIERVQAQRQAGTFVPSERRPRKIRYAGHPLEKADD